MTGLNEKTIAIQSSLDLMNEKLDDIITLLGGAPPTPTATLDDLLAELVLIKTNTADIHTDTMSMDGKLLAIRNYIKNPAEEALEDDYTSLMYNLMWIRRAIAAPTFAGALDYPVQTELRAFNVNNDVLISTTNDIMLNIIYNTMVNVFTNLGISSGASPSYVYYGWLSQVLNWLAKISGSEGVPFDGGNRNIIQLLAKIADRPESTIGSGLIPDQICFDPYVSTEMVLVPGISDPLWPSLIYAKFGATLPDGLSYGSVFGIGYDYTELINDEGDWDGWKIYVASSAANFGMYTGVNTDDSLARYPTNVWVSLGGYDQHLSVFVPGVDSVKVYLCGDGWGGGGSSGGPWGGGEPTPPDEGTCYEIDSVAAEYFYNPGFTLDMQAIQFTTVDGVSCTDEHTFTESTEGFDMVCTVAIGNFVGWTVEVLSGTTPITIALVSPSGTRTTETVGGSIFTVPSNTASMLICNAALGGSAASSPFTIRLCSPVIP
jgi:hypothetical protein